MVLFIIIGIVFFFQNVSVCFAHFAENDPDIGRWVTKSTFSRISAYCFYFTKIPCNKKNQWRLLFSYSQGQYQVSSLCNGRQEKSQSCHRLWHTSIFLSLTLYHLCKANCNIAIIGKPLTIESCLAERPDNTVKMHYHNTVEPQNWDHPYGTSWNGLNIEVVKILNHNFSKTNIFHAKLDVIQYLKTQYWIQTAEYGALFFKCKQTD